MEACCMRATVSIVVLLVSVAAECCVVVGAKVKQTGHSCLTGLKQWVVLSQKQGVVLFQVLYDLRLCLGTVPHL